MVRTILIIAALALAACGPQRPLTPDEAAANAALLNLGLQGMQNSSQPGGNFFGAPAYRAPVFCNTQPFGAGFTPFCP